MTESTLRGFSPRHVLCPVDWSDHAILALKYAAAGAREFGARLTVLHGETFELPRYFVRSEADRLAGELQRARAGAHAALADHVRQILGDVAESLAPQCRVVELHPVEAILTEIEREGVDLVVLGTRGLGGLQRLLLGSVAENVLRHASVPVFTVRQREHDFIDVSASGPLPEIDRILCPVNGSPVSGGALRAAASVAERFGAALQVLRVREDGEGDFDVGAWVRAQLGSARPAELTAREGDPAEEILAEARLRRADLLVVGGARRPALQAAFFGSTTEALVRHAPAPVLVVPADTAS
ncbi:MAG: universal stress protein [Proteobacteria bacterium]|nr:universal stress protein [Pseudomonadota bacterium]